MTGRILRVAIFAVCAFSLLAAQDNPIAIVIHGGAGTILRENMPPEREKEYRAKLEEALNAGYAVLKQGGTSLDAVEAAIHIMEDSPLFNAGKGAVFTSEGTNELDAAIMDGATLNAGAVAGLKRIKSPITLARWVMEKSPHVMMIGDGAEQFAKEQGMEFVDPSYFKTEQRWNQWMRMKEREKQQQSQPAKQDSKPQGFNDAGMDDHKFGTVGCVALDKNGNIAAGTSTGGTSNKKYGRVGDVPIIGGGTYANNKTCGVSCTGTGEYFIRSVVAHDVSALMEYEGMSLKDAANLVVMDKLVKMNGDGGLIALDAKGNIVMPFNTSGMYRGYIDVNGKMEIGIYKE
ncbi:MAG: isoaspartyl peptidase/L-asparaginase [Ignavibacteriae bacterium]|nr:isoaspartyl peptidase/L-asparaginase [Ignavibacteriota bacterium]